MGEKAELDGNVPWIQAYLLSLSFHSLEGAKSHVDSPPGSLIIHERNILHRPGHCRELQRRLIIRLSKFLPPDHLAKVSIVAWSGN